MGSDVRGMPIWSSGLSTCDAMQIPAVASMVEKALDSCGSVCLMTGCCVIDRIGADGI